jgi:Bacterial Ig-like domain
MPDPITALHYAANGNFASGSYDPGAVGFNLADIASASLLSYLPSGVEGLAYLGMTGGLTASFEAAIDSYIGASNLFGIYIADEPDPSSAPAANLKAEADYIHATLPGVKTFMVEQNLSSNTSPVYAYTPANTDIDLFGLDPYPIQTNVPNNLDYAIIPLDVSVAEADGIPLQDIVPIYQAFGGGQYSTYILPTAAQEQQILSTWGSVVPTPAFDYAYSWGVQGGDTAISNDGALQQVFAVHNGLGTSPPPPANPPMVNSILVSGAGIDSSGNGDLNAGKVVTLTVNFSAPVTVSAAGAPTLALNDGGSATYISGSGSAALTFNYTVAAGQNTSDLVISSLSLNGATIQDGAGNNADLSGAGNYNPAGILQIDTTAPTVAINTIASNNIVTAAKALTGFAISGTSSGVENGQNVTVNILNGSRAVVDSYAAVDQGNIWSVNVTSAQATALADGGYTVTANVADNAGNSAPQASRALTVDEEKAPEPPTLNIANTSLNVVAGGTVALNISATPGDSDDRVSVKISGVPSYETITAPSGDTVTHQRQGSTYTWTVTESASMAGTPLTGLALVSHYTGSGHPTALLTVTASNATSGEAASSQSQTLSVTDPPAWEPTESASSIALDHGPEMPASPATIGYLAAFLDQFMATGFRDSEIAAGQFFSGSQTQSGLEDLAFLSSPHN